MQDWLNVEDNQLVQFARQGNVQAYGEIYNRYADRIYRYFVSHMDNPHDAEDLTEEVFFRVWRSLSNYEEKGIPFYALLFQVARNGLIDFYRRSAQSKQLVSIDDLSIPDDGLDPGEMLLKSSRHKELRDAMKELREDYHTVLSLRFLSGLSPDETAKAMGRSSGAVRVLQHRALAALRDILDGNAGY
ncbi:MAG: sigma-70 family RNA polymerase sigma factor [Anaerolineales bacterium]|nr:sigma-70 family RNA polymerase sigma factor [Anaerolineales bacterium]